LEHLIPSRHPKFTLHVKGQRWFEGSRRDNLDASVLVHFLLMIQLLDVINRVFELFFGWPEDRHAINQVQFFVGVFGLQQ